MHALISLAVTLGYAVIVLLLAAVILIPFYRIRDGKWPWEG